MDLTHIFPHIDPSPSVGAGKLSLSPENFLPMVHMAISDRNEDRYFYLVSQGADPLLRLKSESNDDFFLDDDYEHHYQPDRGLLWLALRERCPRVVRDLMERGEDPNFAGGDSFCPLSRWIFSFQENWSAADKASWAECGEILMEYGADPLRKEQDGIVSSWGTPMTLAEKRPTEPSWGIMRSFIEQKTLLEAAPQASAKRRPRF